MPVVVLYGDESFLLEQAANRLRQQVVNPAMASLCHRVYSSPSLAKVLEAVGSVSLALGGQTLVEIKDFSLLHQASKDAFTDAQLDELKGLLEAVDDSKVVLFLSSKIDGKIKFPKWLVKHPKFRVEKYETFKFWETDKASEFLQQHARQNNIQLLPEAADTLVELMGTELRPLANEVDKLSIYALNRPITRQDVLQLSNHSDNLFLLVNNWILQQKPADTFRDLNEILSRRHPIEIFATVQSYFNNIFRVMWLHSKGAGMDAIAQRTGQKPFTIKKHLTSPFSRVPIQRWVKLKRALVEMEWKTKTGQMDGHLALEVLLGT